MRLRPLQFKASPTAVSFSVCRTSKFVLLHQHHHSPVDLVRTQLPCRSLNDLLSGQRLSALVKDLPNLINWCHVTLRSRTTRLRTCDTGRAATFGTVEGPLLTAATATQGEMPSSSHPGQTGTALTSCLPVRLGSALLVARTLNGERNGAGGVPGRWVRGQGGVHLGRRGRPAG